MNIPFDFTYVTTGDLGVLWNPWGTAITGVPNATLAALPDPTLVCMNPPTSYFFLAGFAVMVDKNGDGKVSIGYYDTVKASFVALYPIVCTDVAGGGIVRNFEVSGIRIPAAATRIPCLQYNGTAGAHVTGDVGLSPVIDLSGNAPTFDPLLDESGAGVQDESGSPVYGG